MLRKDLEKKVDDFVKKYTGKQKGYPTDSDYNGECLSIVKLYIHEVFGINAPPSGSNSAYGYWRNFPAPLPTYFTKVEKTASNSPNKGSVPIWNTNAGGGFGHINISINKGDSNAFTGFDQNWLGRQAHIQHHDYTNVVGWLEPILESDIIDPVITDQTRIPQIDNLEVQAIRSLVNDQKREIENLHTTTSVQAQTIKDLFPRLQALEGDRVELKKEIERLKKSQIEPVFSTGLGKSFYSLAKWLG